MVSNFQDSSPLGNCPDASRDNLKGDSEMNHHDLITAPLAKFSSQVPPRGRRIKFTPERVQQIRAWPLVGYHWLAGAALSTEPKFRPISAVGGTKGLPTAIACRVVICHPPFSARHG
jgi:hypothetical protein